MQSQEKPVFRSACTAYTALPIVSYLHFSVCWWSPKKGNQRQVHIQTWQCHVCHPLVRVTYWTQDSSEAHINLWYQHRFSGKNLIKLILEHELLHTNHLSNEVVQRRWFLKKLIPTVNNQTNGLIWSQLSCKELISWLQSGDPMHKALLLWSTFFLSALGVPWHNSNFWTKDTPN